MKIRVVFDDDIPLSVKIIIKIRLGLSYIFRGMFASVQGKFIGKWQENQMKNFQWS